MFLDYYGILGIKVSATQSDIKTAYRKQAIKWHPDKNPDNDTTSKMQEINEAYLILGNVSSRSRYDVEYEFYTNLLQTKNVSSESYNIQDETLKENVKEARLKAKELAKQALEDLVGMSKVAAKAASNEVKPLLICLIIFNLTVALLFICLKS